uniref:Uncharacterized protein n=1 Tax=viral metagenome TaxID=1070528 RepID=A0A6C0F209_9ZZZZ
MTKTRNNRKSNFRRTKRKRGGGTGTSTNKSAPFNTTRLAAAVSRRQQEEEREKAAQQKKKSAMYQSYAADAEKKKKEDAAKKEEEEAKKKEKEEAKKTKTARKKSAKLQKKAISQLPPIPETPKSSEPPPTTKSPSLSPSQSLAALPPAPKPDEVLPPNSESQSLAASELPPPAPKSDEVLPVTKKIIQKTPARQAKQALKLELKNKHEAELKQKQELENALQLLDRELETTENTCILVKDVFYIDKETDKQADKLLQVNLCKCFFILGRVSQILEDLNYKFMLVLKGTRAMLLAAKERPDILARLKPKRPGVSVLDNKLFETLDVDGTLQLRNGVETPESREERKELATDIFKLIQKHIGEDKLSILQPKPETPDDTVETIGAKVVKLSYKNPDGGITAISDLGFSQITHDYYTDELQETAVEDEKYKLHYRFPSLEDQEREKAAFLEKFKQQWAAGDQSDKSLFNIQHFTRNLNKIRTLLGKETIEMPSARPVQSVEQLQTKKAGLEKLLAMQTDEEKRKLIVEQLELIDKQLK